MLLFTIVAQPALCSDWVASFSRKLADRTLVQTNDRNLTPYFGNDLTVLRLADQTCNPILVIKGNQVPVAGALGSFQHVVNCDGPKPLLFFRLQIAAPAFAELAMALSAKLEQPCFRGSSAVGAKTIVWANRDRLLGLTQSQAMGFTVFFENRQAGPSSDPEGEAALRQDLEADLPSSCR